MVSISCSSQTYTNGIFCLLPAQFQCATFDQIEDYVVWSHPIIVEKIQI